MDLLPIRTPRLLLRHFVATDLEAFQAYRSDPEVGRYQGWEPMPEEDARQFLALQARQQYGAPGVWLQVAVTRRDSGAVIGDLGLCATSDDPAIVELGFTLAKSAQGQGYGSEAVEGVVQALSRQPRVAGVVAITDARNAPAIALLQRAGFVLETTRAATFRGEACQEHRFKFTCSRT